VAEYGPAQGRLVACGGRSRRRGDQLPDPTPPRQPPRYPRVAEHLIPEGTRHGRDTRGTHQRDHPPPVLLQLQVLLTPFARYFAPFVHTTCTLSVPCRYSGLRRIHLAVQTAVPSSSTRGRRQAGAMEDTTHINARGYNPLLRAVPGDLQAKHPTTAAHLSRTQQRKAQRKADPVARLPPQGRPASCLFIRHY